MKALILTALFLSTSAFAQGMPEDFSHTVVPSEKARPEWLSMPAAASPTGTTTWPQGTYGWYYNPANQPANLNTNEVVAALQAAASRWMGMCNIQINYLGLTEVPLRDPSNPLARQPGNVNVWGFSALTGGLAGMGGYTTWGSSGANIVMADIILNTALAWTNSNVSAVVTHEIGHGIGIAHSNVAESVMYAAPYHSYTYMQTLRGDDANACAALYGESPNAKANRAMNWAESVYPSLLAPSPAGNGVYDGYLYRFYASTGNYVGVKNGRAYFMSTDGVIQDMGVLDTYVPMAVTAGY